MIKHVLYRFIIICFVLFNQFCLSQTGLTDDFDGDGIINSEDLDDDNDGILDENEGCQYQIVGGGFENVSGLRFGNNIGVDISPWQISGTGAQFNIVKVDGSITYNYGSNGPEVDANPSTTVGIPQHYLDVAYGDNYFWQTFTIYEAQVVTYSGYFSTRNNQNGVARMSIYTGDRGEQGSFVDGTGTFTIQSFGASQTTPWVLKTRSIFLNPGTYSFNIFMGNYLNFDEGKLDFNSENCGDSDNDGILDKFDLDSDNDGCNDVIESGGTDANGDGVFDGNGVNSQGQITNNGNIESNSYNGLTGTEYIYNPVEISPINHN